jgi:hypothetical protein
MMIRRLPKEVTKRGYQKRLPKEVTKGGYHGISG